MMHRTSCVLLSFITILCCVADFGESSFPTKSRALQHLLRILKYTDFFLLLDTSQTKAFESLTSQNWTEFKTELMGIMENMSGESLHYFAFVKELTIMRSREEIVLSNGKSNFIFVGEPNEFSLLISKMKNPLGHSWCIVTDKNNTQAFLEVLHGLPVSYDSEIYLTETDDQSVHIHETYNRCPNCPSESLRTQLFCTFSISDEDLNIDAPNCFRDKYLRRNELQGISIRVVGVDVLPFMVGVDPTDSTNPIQGGLTGTMFLIFQKALNIKYDLTMLQGYQYGAFRNGSWNGMIGYLNRNDADMTVSEISMAPDRLEFIDFSKSFGVVGRKIYIKKVLQRKDISWSFYSSPFSPLVHFTVLFWVVCMATLLFLSDRYLFLQTQHNSDLTIHETAWISFSTVCQKGAHILPTRRSAKIIFVTFSFTFLVVFCGYSATLISQLAVSPPLSVPFKDLQDFIRKSRGWKAGPIRGDLTQIYMEKTCPELLRKGDNAQCDILVQLWKKVIEVDKDILPLSFDEGIQRLLKGHFAFIASSIGVRNLITQNLNEQDSCSILEMNGDYVSSNLAFGFRKAFPYKPLINYQLLKLHTSGVLKRLQITWLPQQKKCESPSDNGFADATLYDVGVAPLIWILGISLGLVALFTEILNSRRLSG